MHTLLATDDFGLYHMSCHGETTWYEFAKKILELAGRDTRVTAVGNDFYPTPFVRPESSYLDNARLRARGLERMPRWEDALAEYLRTRAAPAASGRAMKILALGGAGYVGSALVPALIERGYEVDVIDLKWFGVHLPNGVSVVDKDVLRCGVDDLVGYDQVLFLGGCRTTRWRSSTQQ